MAHVDSRKGNGTSAQPTYWPTANPMAEGCCNCGRGLQGLSMASKVSLHAALFHDGIPRDGNGLYHHSRGLNVPTK